MRSSKSTILSAGLLVLAFLVLGFYLIRLNLVTQDQKYAPLIKAFLATKNKGNDVATKFISFEPNSNSYLLYGVLDGKVIRDPISITTPKKTLGESILTLRFYFLDKNQKLRSLLIPRIVKLSDGNTFVISYEGENHFNIDAWAKIYEGKKGVPIYPNVYTDIDSFYKRLYEPRLEESIKAFKSPKDEIPWIYNFLKVYYEDWQDEFAHFVTTGDPGKMTMIIPLEFGSDSLTQNPLNIPVEVEFPDLLSNK